MQRGLMSEHEVKVALADVEAYEHKGRGIVEDEADPPPWSELIDSQKVKTLLGVARAALVQAERAAGSSYSKTVKELGEVAMHLSEVAREAEQHIGREEAYLSLRKAAVDLKSLARKTKD